MEVPCLTLPKILRRDFKIPRSLIYKDFPYDLVLRSSGVVCVGDVVSRGCLEVPERVPNVTIIYDLSTRRRDRVEDLSPEAYRRGFKLHNIVNPPGTVSYPSLYTLCKVLRKGGRNALVVKGEEDMLALAAIQCSPDGHLVVFGIPGRGVAAVRVNWLSRLDASLRTLELMPGLVKV